MHVQLGTWADGRVWRRVGAIASSPSYVGNPREASLSIASIRAAATADDDDDTNPQVRASLSLILL